MNIRGDIANVCMRALLLSAALYLAACTPQQQTSETRDQQPKITSKAIVAADGAELPYRRWDAKKPKAFILAMHGFNDYSKSFTMFAEYARSHQVSLLAYDQRGFGKTEQFGIWGGDENLTNDVCDTLEIIQKSHNKLPIFLLGDSMGASVVIQAYQRCKLTDPEQIKGLILVAPAIWGENTMNPLYRVVLWMMAHVLPDKKFTGEGLEIRATDNLEVMRDMSVDPYVIKATRADAIYGLMNMMDEAHSKLSVLTPLPILILYGHKDEVIPDYSIDNLAEHLPYAARIDYDDGYHMLLRDLQRENVYKDIIGWLNEELYAE